MPDSATLGIFVVASLILLVTPGPAVIYIVARSIDQGWIAGVVSSFGMGVGSLVHIAVAWLGMTAILFSSPAAFELLKYAGAAYLVYLGVQTLRADDTGVAARMERQGLKRVFSQAIVVNLLNPKSAVFFIAFMPQFVDPSRGSPAGQLLLLCGVFYVLALLTDTAYALLAGKLGDLLRTNPAFRRRQRYFSASIYIALGIAAALSGVMSRPESGAAPAGEPQQVAASPEVRELTVMAWNIWHGGRTSMNPSDHGFVVTKFEWVGR